MEPKDLQRKLEETIEKLEKRIVHLEEQLAFSQREIDRLQIELVNERLVVPTTGKPFRIPNWAAPNSCSKCGLKLEGIMGYVCSNKDCPSGMGSPWSNAA